MTDNFYTINAIADYLNNVCKSSIITEFFTQEKDRIVLLIEGCRVANAIEFSAERRTSFLILRRDFSKASKNVVNLFNECGRLRVSEVSVFENDRALKFSTDSGVHLIFTFFARPNVLLVKNDIVVSAFKDSHKLEGSHIKSAFERDIAVSKLNANQTASGYLKSLNPNLGEIYRKEIEYRAGVISDAEVNDEIKLKLRDSLSSLIKEIGSERNLLYKIEGKPVMSLCELRHLRTDVYKKFDDINELASYFAIARLKYSREKELRKIKIQVLERKLNDLERKRRSFEEQIRQCTSATEFQRAGEFLIANLHMARKGMTELEGTLEGGEKISVKLKPELSPAMNATLYFDKAKKQKSSVGTLQKKLSAISKSIETVKAEIENAQNISDLKTLEREKRKEAKLAGDETSMFRKFKVEGGFEVWVGKDSASNDLLTTRHSAQNDLWFHVRGTGGSHTVLKTGNSKSPVPKEAIKSAASIAAYYSKARNAGNVPVAYCERKHVKKKKGFKQGAVIMEREKVIFVKPVLPEAE